MATVTVLPPMLKLKVTPNIRQDSALRNHRQRGVSLLESLVALLVLALGVLGLLGVQLRTLVETQTGVSRSMAMKLAEDLGDRARSNPLGAAGIPSYVVGWGAAPAAPVNCFSNPCTNAQSAAFDLVRWKTSVAQALPDGRATSFVSPTDARQLGVMIAWRANEASADADYLAPLVINAAATGGPVCPAGLICHLVYVQI